MIEQLQQFQFFHFLQPLWLLSILPASALAVLLWRQPSSGVNWRRAIAADLLEHLLESHFEQKKRWPWLALLGWVLAALAMAGPTWEKLPQPVLQKRDALAIVLDLSLSMYAEDIKPSRLQRARFKILDILNRRHEGLTSLIAYSGDAHVVSPLTDDTATIANLVPALAPDMMPLYGSDPVAGIEQAIQLMHNAGFERGRILLISDEISDANIDAIATRLGDGHWQLSLMGVGSEQGAPIPINQEGNNGGFLKQRDGNIVVAQLHRERFEQLAHVTGGRYSDLRVDDKDLDALLPASALSSDETRSVQREFDQWRERGSWLVMLLLPLAALAFRRGWLLMLFIVPLSAPSQALEWRDLWQRPDQQAQQALISGDAKSAAEKFRDPDWRAAALYRAGDYAGAAQTLKDRDTVDADYNRGNALARAGQLPEALAAFDAALKKNPNFDDAKANRELVENLLQQQKQQQQKQKQQGQKKDQQQEQGDSSNKDNSADKNSQSNEDKTGQDSSQKQPGGDSHQSADANKGESRNGQPDAKANDKNNAQQNTKPSADQAQNQNAQAAKDAQPNQSNDAAPAATQNNQEKQRQQQQTATAQNPQTAANDTQSGDKETAIGNATDSKEQQQQQRATEQWLRQIPDDPAGLLRRKFLYEHRQQQRAPTARDSQQPLW